jgi:hypothetical protein
MSKYEKLITKLYPDPTDAAIARSLVQRFSGDPRMDDGRLEAMLHEGARANEMASGGEMTPDQARDFFAGFAESIGTPPDLMVSLGQWWDSAPAEVAAEQPQPAETEKPAAEPNAGVTAASADAGKPAGREASPARSAPVAPDRNAARETVEKFETAMRAPQGSELWASYWRNPQAQAEYRSALETVHGLAEPPLSSGGATPASAPDAAP